MIYNKTTYQLKITTSNLKYIIFPKGFNLKKVPRMTINSNQYYAILEVKKIM